MGSLSSVWTKLRYLFIFSNEAEFHGAHWMVTRSSPGPGFSALDAAISTFCSPGVLVGAEEGM